MFMGVRLRALREQRQLTQVQMAQQLGISPSYLNQIENNDRPLTVPVLLRLQSRLGIDPQFFSEDEDARLLAQVRDVVADTGRDVPTAELQGMVQQMPALAQTLLHLHRRCKSAEERVIELAGSDSDRSHGQVGGLLQPHEEVRDFFYARHNYIGVLDEAAESLGEQLLSKLGGQPRSELVRLLIDRLGEVHGVRVQRQFAVGSGDLIRHFDAETRVLQLGSGIDAGQQAFQLATQLAHLEQAHTITALTREATFNSEAARALTCLGLASYFAGALILPYRRFLQAAEQLKYDIELLAERFGVSYETVCHRLSTLQRPDARGIPFFFIRVDRAGNISKRQSATDFHFSRTGGTCPLWGVYEAFSQPDRILTQLARMPDGRVYLWVARAVTHRRGGYSKPARTFAIGLGCDVRHAERLVYAKGLNLNDPDSAIPIGAGCKICDRTDCSQRAFPALGRELQLDPNSRYWAPYNISNSSKKPSSDC
jgi:predicted transcriptional regulator/transcriptional regulator with XRE-family HTH domain